MPHLCSKIVRRPLIALLVGGECRLSCVSVVSTCSDGFSVNPCEAWESPNRVCLCVQCSANTLPENCKKRQKAITKRPLPSPPFPSPSPPPFPASACRSFDQMSVSTQFSVQTESDWDPRFETTSMISFDMSQHSPTSPSKYFKVGFQCLTLLSCARLVLSCVMPENFFI